MLKKVFFQIHWFLGITAGLILSLMGVTGAIYSYEPQILKWINQDSYVVEVAQTPKLTPAELYQHFNQQQPEIEINSITIASDPTESSTINIKKEGARRGYNMMVNPYTAAVLPEVKGRDTLQFIQRLHRNLTAGEFGAQITGASTLMLIFFVLSGIYLRFPKKHSLKQWFFIKPKLKGRNFIWDLHAVVGTWVVVFYLLFACTGLYWSYDWWRAGMFKVMGVEQPQRNQQNNDRGKDKQPALEKTQVNTILTQTWTGVNAQIGREYSSLTLNIPKRDDAKVELSFVDLIPQHERARNQAIYNYQDNKFEKFELYETKKLNEKIMSSMLPVHRGSFFGSTYQFIAMLASLAMPLFFITGWMLYLKRRKQKKLTQAARQSISAQQIDPNAKPWLITYATQTGVAEQLAWRTATSLQEAQQPTTVKPIQQLTEQDLLKTEYVLFVVSTYGTGEAPDLATSFSKKLMQQNLNLSQMHYAVLALGSKEYPDSYCSFGYAVDTWLKQCKAQPLFELIKVDNANSNDIQQWNQALSVVTKHELHAMNIEKVFDQWTLSERTLLNPDSLGQAAYNIELTTTSDMTWHAGDIAEIQPANSLTEIQNFLIKHQTPAHSIVKSLNQNIEQLLWDRNLRVEIKPFSTLEDLLEQLPTLPTREYSIASIPSQQILRLVVRQKRDENDQLGLGSGWLTEFAELKQTIALRIRTNESFHLIDDNRPIICIGNGTGIAGLMSLLQQRNRQNYTANWLIFGERKREHDFFYQETIEAWKNMGTLQRLDLAFSRDQEQRIYVQDILRNNANELIKWIEQGAVIYVCGSIENMASGVDQALIDILSEEKLDALRQAGRYRRDVY
ncbi:MULTISPECIES: sulfite reductase flavoprotein subunit alpha [unclassified Acinetobacter]|uniref:PepSY domain-containing protein n=1 Tax=unclassified Acinetobacter TaxID=196816 RepID=UPI001F4AC907|nr:MULTISPECIES: sulfite reductase flavoprotein subunit alpha [unclassified Acinetobacter]MCH7350532.1 sulfite reductase flavoprotein subunit alpha [Acinetobacter sp. NIPH 2023]MCH7357828.1 sulfite reductase flavoprotein subunit alpha [Acinetobacter sp. NIPH 2024]